MSEHFPSPELVKFARDVRRLAQAANKAAQSAEQVSRAQELTRSGLAERAVSLAVDLGDAGLLTGEQARWLDAIAVGLQPERGKAGYSEEGDDGE